jgi:hypothetical protein
MNEPQAKKYLEGILPREFFNIYKECKGVIQSIKPIKQLYINWKKTKIPKYLKIDYILEPTEKLLKAGWEIGYIGVEVKRTNERMYGKILSQIFDYQNCLFEIPGNNNKIPLSMIFLFPYERFYSLMASIMLQEGIGVIRYYQQQSTFKLLHGNGMNPILSIWETGFQVHRPRFGYVIGSK